MPEPIQLRAVKQRSLEIDRDAGTIRGVSVISQGEAAGHGFEVDRTMLDQVAAGIGTDGVKVRLGHPGLFADGTGTLIGRMVNAKRDGARVRADLSLPDYATHVPGRGDVRAYLMDVAETHPDSIGVSIAFVPGEFEQIEGTGQRLGRVAEVLAADIVDEPAANQSGLLSQLQGASAAPPPNPPKEETSMAETATSETGGGAEQAQPQNNDPQPQQPQQPQQQQLQNPGAAPAHPAPDRAAEILKMAKLRPEYLGIDWAYQHIQAGSTIEQARKDGMEKIASHREPIPTAPPAVSVGQNRNTETLNAAIRDAVILRTRSGEKIQAHERSSSFRGLSLVDMHRHYLHGFGVSDAFNLSRRRVVELMGSKALQRAYPAAYELAHSTGDFDGILVDAIEKSLRVQYDLLPVTWSIWASRGTAPDFKTINRVQVSAFPELATRTEGEEVNYGTITDNNETYNLQEYAQGVRITRQAIINDDLSVFDRVPTMAANRARRKEDDVAYAVLTGNANMADGNSLFDSSNHSNIASGTGVGGAPSVETLSETEELLMLQTDPNGADLDLRARYLLVPVNLGTTAMQVINSTVDPSKSNATNNPFNNRFEVVMNPRLDRNNTSYWYLLADPSVIDTVEVSFLEDEQAPQVRQETDFDTGDVKIAVTHVVAAKALDWRGMVRNNGS